jgi:hypothetical protein
VEFVLEWFYFTVVLFDNPWPPECNRRVRVAHKFEPGFIQKISFTGENTVLPQQDDHSDGPSTLPAPELNPLLNPLLGQNMGRWAEVYFTSPPEKREQAVLDLLRELQGDNPTPEVAAASAISTTSEEESQPVSELASRRAEVPVAAVRCRACGRENPTSHRFCGMCGSPVVEQRSAADLNITDLHVADHHVADFQNVEFESADLEIGDGRRDGLGREYPSTEDRRIAHLFAQEPASLTQNSAPELLPSATAVSEPALNSNGFLSARSGRELEEHEYTPTNLFEPALDSRPYRRYIGIALAVLVVAYVAWRSMQTSQNSHVALAPPAATRQQAGPAPTSQIPSTADAPDRTSEPASPGNAPAAVPSNVPSNVSSSNITSSNNAGDRRTASPLPKAVTATASPDAATQVASPTASIDETSLQAEPVSANGAQELTIAQRYLNGTDGQERNSAEGAKWLWKAIAKHNADATLLLSDLYLKGDGVEKNCDQARVLLDAAAGRGMKGAGDRLRHLQAFGCQ